MELKFIVELVKNPVRKGDKTYYRYTITIPSILVKQFLLDIKKFELYYNGETITLKPIPKQ